jgi:hypothetical protein
MARPQFLHLQENMATSIEARQKFAALARGVISQYAAMTAATQEAIATSRELIAEIDARIAGR